MSILSDHDKRVANMSPSEKLLSKIKGGIYGIADGSDITFKSAEKLIDDIIEFSEKKIAEHEDKKIIKMEQKDLLIFDDIRQNIKILAEECNEVIHEHFKIDRFGLESYHPDDQDRTPNVKKLEQEIGDVLAMVDILKSNNIGITAEGLEQAKIRKINKLHEFYDFRLKGK